MSGGENKFIGCRFEQLNLAVSDWLILGNRDKILNCAFYQSTEWRAYSATTDFWCIRVPGVDCKIEGLMVEASYAGHLLKLDTTSSGCVVDAYYNEQTTGASNNAILDAGLDNSVSYPLTGTIINNADSFSNHVVNQFISDSANLSTSTQDGTTKAIAVGSLESSTVQGPHADGYSYKIDFTGGNNSIYWTHFAGALVTHNFSVWLYSETGVEVELFMDADFRKGYMLPAARWVRVDANFDTPTALSRNFGVRGTNGELVYLSAPQITQRATTTIGRSGPEGYVRSAVFITPPFQGQHSPRLMQKRMGNGAPLAGRFYPPEISLELTPSAALNGKYGNICITGGAPGVWVALNTSN